MPRYLLSVHVGPDDRPQQMTDAEQRQGYERVARLEEEMRSSAIGMPIEVRPFFASADS
jgi:hypothetical protein